MFFLTLSILSYLLQNFGNKKFCLAMGGSSAGGTLFQNGVCCLSASVVLAVFGGLRSIPWEAVVFAVLFGAAYLGTVFFLLCAFSEGTVGLSTLMCNLGSFIAAFYGIFRFHDAVTPWIASGFICMLFSTILATPSRGSDEKGGWKWFLFALGSGICNGMVASIKREAVAIMSDGTETFLSLGFFFAGLIAVVFAFSFRKNRCEVKNILSKRIVLLFGVLAGLGTAGGNLFQMKALTRLPSTVVFPLTAGIMVISLWLASLLVYKETKAKLRNVFAVILCVVAIVLVNMK